MNNELKKISKEAYTNFLRMHELFKKNLVQEFIKIKNMLIITLKAQLNSTSDKNYINDLRNSLQILDCLVFINIDSILYTWPKELPLSILSEIDSLVKLMSRVKDLEGFIAYISEE